MDDGAAAKRREALERCERNYKALKSDLGQMGFVLQGSLAERRMECGKTQCSCHTDPSARHGPYYQWSWKDRGRTASVYLDKEQAQRCKEWLDNNRRVERILRQMRAISLRAARLYKISKK